MSITVRRFDCTPEQVFTVLADPWVYPTWVVGASRLRSADPDWPRPTTRLHHSIGVWPLVLNDVTRVNAWDAPRRVELTANTWPFGRERVIIEVQPRDNGSLVLMEERVVSGPLRFIPKRLMDVVLNIRNAETLRRLEYVAKGRAAEALTAAGRAAEGRLVQGQNELDREDDLDELD
ncbi:SRPBCC family protein [Leifsonia poae]|uniref:SRPBCC family protein n=1 Tax=Leifsonia poae TaxID=110933 RepID=UPI003D672845